MTIARHSSCAAARRPAAVRRAGWTAVISVLGLTATGWCASAHALDDGVVNPSVFAALQYNSNTFKLADGATNGNANSITRTVGVGLNVDKSYGLQRIVIDGNVTRYLYDQYGSLDATSHQLSAAYGWRLTPSLGGNLIYRHNDVPNDFADVGFQTTSNLRTTSEKRADVDLRPDALIRPTLAVYEVVEKSERPTFQQENSTTRSIDASIVYGYAASSSIAPYVRTARGNYQDTVFDPTQLLASSFHEREAGLRFRWLVSGVTDVSGQIGWIDRTHNDVPSRDFSGVTGRLNVLYTLTGKSTLEAYANRQLYSSQSAIASYIDQQDLTIAARYLATGKISLRPRISYLRRVFKGAPFAVSSELHETTRTTSLDVSWAAMRSFDLTLVIAREVRRANGSGLDFVNDSALLQGRLHF